jgi:CDGSH-type Zn-finger protein
VIEKIDLRFLMIDEMIIGMYLENEVCLVAEVTIQVRDNGSLRVSGPVTLLDGEGNEFTVKESFSLCRCGLSESKPFCDGTHKRVGFQDAPRAK